MAVSLLRSFVHLGPAGSAVEQPPFSGMDWYEHYAARHDADGSDGRLLSMFEFTESWAMWEMHPVGDEVVICTSGSMILLQELADGRTARIVLQAGDHAINPRGCWHTADLDRPAAAIFITPGLDTQHRPR
ncbi:hypothetical protein GCM10007973_23280 [Polymorphobacter multimanifer]|uniref:Quercetin dioxygenase-like cupin family protein n=1 Tax=Polymorphobacter multimanifer TaxID=1070431 RepID=A0A841LB73_9SPHN|nr:cupin domain-containing protein [Polymorphobacter multimanifer]MBB6228911.1 quercetin dioxygenase-like cupin family protein [Polymorphobacter multimanifer]GGI86012.1 hypothetical protein GCM10007973_23280 [Polymorphobacter multimanifer]